MHTCPEFSAKDPAEIIIYALDFTNLLDPGETITSASWSISIETAVGTDTSTLALVGVADISESPIIKQKVQLGTAGYTYSLTCQVLTNAGQTLRALAHLPVRTGPC